MPDREDRRRARFSHTKRDTPHTNTAGFTLVEVLLATVLTLVIMGALVQLLSYLTNKVADSRAVVETNDRLRQTKQLLQNDLFGATAPTRPPLSPSGAQGYFEVIEGPIGPIYVPNQTTLPMTPFTNFIYAGTNTNGETRSANTANGRITRTSDEDVIDDNDDILMFTTKSYGQPFVGLYNGSYITSEFAEISWFLRGTILYRRILLIRPDIGPQTYNRKTGQGGLNYAIADLSMRQVGGVLDPAVYSLNGPVVSPPGVVVTNSLGDLTKRECRYAHIPTAFPHDVRGWNHVQGSTPANNTTPGGLRSGYGLPILKECVAVNGRASSALQTGQGTWPYPLYEPTGMNAPFYSGGAMRVRSQYPPSPLNGIGRYYDPKRVLIYPDNRAASFDSKGNIIAMTGGGLGGTGTMLIGPSGTVDSFGGMGKSGALYSPTFNWVSGIGASGGNAMNNYGGQNAGAFGTPSTRADDTSDVMMTNVVSFDVKVWDPGAPILRLRTPAQGATPAVNATIIPGDPGYRNALATFMLNPVPPAGNGGNSATTVTIDGFGAYVDLNYMQFTGIDPYAYNAQLSVGLGPPPYAFVQNLNSALNYEDALRAFENNKLGILPNSSYRPLPRPKFSGPGDRRSMLNGILPNIPGIFTRGPGFWPLNNQGNGTLSWTEAMACVYDTWSDHYEHDGIDNDCDQVIDEGTNGVDDPEYVVSLQNPVSIDHLQWGRIMHSNVTGTGTAFYNSGIDDAREQEAPPPYPHALRGIQIRIRVLENDSKQVREVTLVHECLQE
jgi:type II secretory pathway pseudopilin PulG